MHPIEYHRIQVNKTARYFTYGSLNRNTKYLWIICHGYAQTAESFIQNFTHLDPEIHFIVAPEGLSRFYKNGFEGEVVASWMTKLDRLDEISDYARYLQTICEYFVSQISDEVKIILFGYSQGGSTVYRWITSKYPYFNCFVNWAGWIPEDLDYEDSKHYLNAKKNLYIYGLEDRFLPTERINHLSNFCQENDLHVKFYHFNGKHVIDKDFLNIIIQKHL